MSVMSTGRPSWVLVLVALLALAPVTEGRVAAARPLAAPGMASVPDDERPVDDFTRPWQGAWVVYDGDYPGSVQAWMVRGEEVTVFDPASGDVETEGFALVSPCRIVRTRTGAGAGGQTIKTADTFAFARDGLHLGATTAAGGVLRGGVVTACIDDQVYTYDTRDGRCRRWDPTMSGVLSGDALCVIDKGAVNWSFIVRPLEGGDSKQLDFYGDAVLSVTLAASRADEEPSFDSAIRHASEALAP